MNREEFLSSPERMLDETPHLLYVDGYKYQSRNDMVYRVFVYPPQDIETPLVVLRKDGWLWVSRYFAWDGCSGPTVDTITNMCGGQAHDALYALHRMRLLPLEWRPASDSVLERLMVRDGSTGFRAGYYKWAVKQFGEGSALPTGSRPILTAPRRLQ